MDKYLKENLTKLREEKTTYDQMIDYCCDNCIMNNYIVEELQKKDIFFETYCGSEYTYYNKDDEEITEEEFKKLNIIDDIDKLKNYDNNTNYIIIDCYCLVEVDEDGEYGKIEVLGYDMESAEFARWF